MRKRFIAVLLLSCVLTACGSNTPVEINNNLKANIIYNKDIVRSDVNLLLTTGEIEKTSSFSTDFAFDMSDMTSIADDYRDYVSDGAYYIQTGTYMYRFQFNNEGLIVSYIKYNLEG